MWQSPPALFSVTADNLLNGGLDWSSPLVVSHSSPPLSSDRSLAPLRIRNLVIQMRNHLIQMRNHLIQIRDHL